MWKPTRLQYGFEFLPYEMNDCLHGKILQVVLKTMFSHLQRAYSLLHHIGLRITQSHGHGQVV
jgi:hypothetical protein